MGVVSGVRVPDVRIAAFIPSNPSREDFRFDRGERSVLNDDKRSCIFSFRVIVSSSLRPVSELFSVGPVLLWSSTASSFGQLRMIRITSFRSCSAKRSLSCNFSGSGRVSISDEGYGRIFSLMNPQPRIASLFYLIVPLQCFLN